ncbi:phosphoribosylglycinamide formyltransferase [Priestia flexa]|uniref:phosphoribosylglycinamide formyltransferase n=1 Tax=Priestia flexa TaxID=86664 RepID=UPI00209E5B9B|nr:phosphoribosylglycinamide formyltransferase [Priestia flexa]MCP1187812.1 phosphoribosylglycinamide formyltransferase [Priestia flexa]
MMNIAVFASGNGSNFQSLYEAMQSGQLKATVKLVICNKPEAYVIERAKACGIPCFVCSPKDFPDKAAYEQAILNELQANSIDFLVLAGYMRLVGPTLLQPYKNRIVNIHPSLLPAFPGMDAIGQAFDAGVKVIGITVHFVDEGMDTGPIIDQQAIRVNEEDTRETVEARIHEIEHTFYPQVLNKLFQQLVVK